MILGTGHLSPIRPGLLQGNAALDVRGTFPIEMHSPYIDRGVQAARFRVGSWEGAAHKVTSDADNDGIAVWMWRAWLSVDGYQMRIDLRPGDQGWAVTFHDAPQREPFDLSNLEAA